MKRNNNNDVFSRLNEKARGNDSFTNPDEYLLNVHYAFCKEFGFIHPDDFYELPMGFVLSFVDLMKKEAEENKKRMKK